MNWIAELCDLYDKNQDKIGLIKENEPVLLPLYHTTVAAQITVTIDSNGNFLRAEIVSEEDKSTIIPVTEKSASRTAGIEPHPLCDNLKYLAGDYSIYISEKDYSVNHGLYMEQLNSWADSLYSHEKVRAVRKYLQKNSLMGDLYSAGILKLDENGQVSRKEKIQIVSQIDAFVRFRIETGVLPAEGMLEDESGQFATECWKDRTLQKSYMDWCESLHNNQGLSYLSGSIGEISYLQPKKIRNEGDGAKLISSNDESNYTFRGRFINKEEAFAIGYEDSQKAHNALKWIIRKQGYHCGGLCIVTWESDLNKLPNWQDSADEILDELEEDEIWDKEESDRYAGTGEAYAARFNSAIMGYMKKLQPASKTVIMAFDAATTGRLAMLEFKEINSSRYLECLQTWHGRCCWRHSRIKKEKKRYDFCGMVGLKEAAELLYGTEQNGYFSLKGKEERYKDVAKRLMPCILDGKEVPLDMVRIAVQRASSPEAFESRFLWERILTLACSFVRQQYICRYKTEKEEWKMALDESCKERDYLYGRLLALADRIEYRTYDKGDSRETNAKRYMKAFSQHPFRTWKVIEEKLGPYLLRLDVAERLVYQNMLHEICDRFSISDFANDAALSGLYLLGFHNQAYAFKQKKDAEED